MTATPSASPGPVPVLDTEAPRPTWASRFAARLRPRKRTWLPALVSLVITAAVCAAFVVVRERKHFQPAEFWAYDLFLNWRGETKAKDRVVVIGITEEDITSGVVHFPIWDLQMTRLLKALETHNPRAIGVDIFRDLPVSGNKDDAPIREKAELVQHIKDHPDIVMIALWGKDDWLVKPPPGVKASQVGFADFVIDEQGGVIRRSLLTFTDPQGKTKTSLSGRLALKYLAAEDPPIKPEYDDATGVTTLGKGRLRWVGPDDGAYVDEPADAPQFFMDYRRKIPDDAPMIDTQRRRWFDLIPVRRVLAPAGSADAVRSEEIAGRVVLVGMTAPSVKDMLDTPLDSDRYGVELHAAAVDQLLRVALEGESPTRVWPDWLETAWIVLCGVAGGLLGLAVRAPWRFWATAVSVCALIFAGSYWMFDHGWWVPVIPPMLNWLVCAAAVTQFMSYQEKADRAVLNKLFEMHVSRTVVKEVWANRDQFIREGRMSPSKVVATVMFTDLQGFTTLSEKMGTDVIGWLNRYMSEMSAVVDAHGGFVNKYIGDAVMAIWGPPLPRTAAEQRQDAVNAVACAVEMRRKLHRLNDQWREHGFGGLCMRVGILTGEVVAGSLGSADRLEYTVIGPVVNTAARLESYDKDLMDDDITGNGVCRILIGQTTLDYLGGRFEARRIGEVELKGLDRPVTVYGVVSDLGTSPAAAAPRAAVTARAGL